VYVQDSSGGKGDNSKPTEDMQDANSKTSQDAERIGTLHLEAKKIRAGDTFRTKCLNTPLVLTLRRGAGEY
jgi:hypothetical protein